MPDNLELPELPRKIKKGFSLFRKNRQTGQDGQVAKQESEGSSLVQDKQREILSNKNEEIPPEKYFVLRTGDRIKNIEELKSYLSFMDDETFKHHVKNHKNDFANWIEHVFGKKELAYSLRNCSTKEEMIDVLNGKEISKLEVQDKKVEENQNLKFKNTGFEKENILNPKIIFPKENKVPALEKQEKAFEYNNFVPDKLPEIEIPVEKNSALSDNKKKKPAIVFSLRSSKKEKPVEKEQTEKILPKIETPAIEKIEPLESKKEVEQSKEIEEKIEKTAPQKIELPSEPEYKTSWEKEVKKQESDKKNKKYNERIKELESMLKQKKKEVEELKGLLESEKAKLLDFEKKVEDKISELDKRESDIREKEKIVLQRFNELKSIKENLDLKEAEIVKKVNALFEEREMLDEKEKEIIERVRELEVQNKKLDEEKKKNEERIRKLSIREQKIKQNFEKLSAFEKNLKEKEKDVNKKTALIEKGREILKKMPFIEKNYKKLMREIPKLENKLKNLEEKYRNEKNFILNKTKELEAKENELKQRELELEDKKEKLLKVQFRLLEEKNKLEEERLKLYIKTEKLNYGNYESIPVKEIDSTDSHSDLLKPLPMIDSDESNSAIEEAKEAIKTGDFERANNLIKMLEEKHKKMPESDEKKDLYYKILELRTDFKIATL
ncbi:MAG: hypothetical protein ACP5H9_00450 [Candidatus Woesearchaeota archaeon]